MQVIHLWERPHLQFFPMAWLAAAVLVAKRSKLKWTSGRWRNRFGIAAWAIGIAAGLAAAIFYSPWLAQAAAILAITGWGLLRLDSVPWIRWIGWTLLLWITLPLPSGLDAGLVSWLQLRTAESAGALLDLFGVPHLRQRTLIEIRSRQLFVDEACSGIDSLYSLTAISLVMMLWQRRPLIVGLLTVLSVPIWAWLGNVMRILVIVVLLDQFQFDLSEGIKHTALGLITFTFSSICLFATLSAFSELFLRFYSSAMPRDRKQWHVWYNMLVSFPGKAPVLADEEDEYFSGPDLAPTPLRSTKRATNVPAPRSVSSRVLVMAAVCALITLGLAIRSMERNIRLGNSTALPRFGSQQLQSVFTVSSMPEMLLQAKRVGFREERRLRDSVFGEFSRVWSYRDSRCNFILSLDFPFRGYHPLWVCYTNAGKTAQGAPTPIGLPSQPADSEPTVMFVELRDDLGDYSYLWFLLFEADGDAIKIKDYANEGQRNSILERIQSAFVDGVSPEPVSYQMQLYVESSRKLTTSERAEYLQLFDAAVPLAKAQVRTLTSRE